MKRLVLFALLALLVGGSRPASADADVDRLLTDLNGDDVSRRSAALTALRRDKPPRVPRRLVDLLPAYGLMGRYYGVLVIDAYPEKIARPAFASLAKGDDPYLRLASGRALLKWGASNAVALIVEALRTPGVPANERLYMVNRLHGVQEPSVRAALRAELDEAADIGFLGAVLWVLATEPANEDRVAVRALTTAARPDVRALAAAYLLRHGEEDGTAVLVEALGSGELEASPLYRINSFLSQAGHVPKPILEAVAALLEGQADPNVARAAITILKTFRYAKAASALQKLMRHDNALVAKAAFEALAELGGAIDAEQLRPLLEAEDDAQRISAAELLRRMDDPSGLAVLVGILRSGERSADRVAAARALGPFTRRAAVDPLLDALMDGDVGVRGAALRSLDLLFRNLFPYRRLDLVAAGYAATGTEPSRREAVGVIRAWWKAHGKGGSGS